MLSATTSNYLTLTLIPKPGSKPPTLTNPKSHLPDAPVEQGEGFAADGVMVFCRSVLPGYSALFRSGLGIALGLGLGLGSVLPGYSALLQ